jgi:hypothetical protein
MVPFHHPKVGCELCGEASAWEVEYTWGNDYDQTMVEFVMCDKHANESLTGDLELDLPDGL